MTVAHNLETAADIVRDAVGTGRLSERAETDLLEMEKDLRGIAAVLEDRDLADEEVEE